MYLAVVKEIASDINIRSRGESYQPEQLSTDFCYYVVQPSYAAADVFSLLQSSFSTKQNSSLDDYICTSVMFITLVLKGLRRVYKWTGEASPSKVPFFNRTLPSKLEVNP